MAGSFFSNPTDIIMVRFQNEGLLPPEERRNYKGFVDAFTRMCREEGIKSLWNGAVSNMARSASLTVG